MSTFRRALFVGLALALLPLAGRSQDVPPDRAVIVVKLPPSARLLVDEHPTTQTGPERTLITPSLPPGQTFTYELTAAWDEGGKQRKEIRQVTVRAGRQSAVDFTASALATAAGNKSPAPAVKSAAPKERTFRFTYSATVKDLPPGKEAHVWLPVATSGPFQQVTIESKELPADAWEGTEKTYGNRMLHFTARADKDGTIPIKVVYRITRKEVRTGEYAKLTFKPAEKENLARFLQPDALVPVGRGKPVELMREKKLPRDQFAAAKDLYDLVNTHMKYSKEGEGWGRGDAEWACDSKFGNCTDFHSLFISMARTSKIPAKFEMGFPVPEKRGSGPVGGYHCWAWFLPEGKGWVPVDISEANRHPSLQEYYFGNLTEDRVQFSTGRDIELVPRQKGPALNYFIYPYVEVDGRPHPNDKVSRTFSYQDLPDGR